MNYVTDKLWERKTGRIYNIHWCGSCKIPQEETFRALQKRSDTLQVCGHSCMQHNNSVLWWCGYEICGNLSSGESTEAPHDHALKPTPITDTF